MPQVVIENPVINSPFSEPQRHFRFSDEGITNEIVVARRPGSYFTPIPALRKIRKSGKQLVLDGEWMFIPCSGSSKEVVASTVPTRVRALEDRIACEITFPRLAGHRYEVSAGRLSATFDAGSRMAARRWLAECVTLKDNTFLQGIPYPLNGEESAYYPDFIVRLPYTEPGPPWDTQNTIRAALKAGTL